MSERLAQITAPHFCAGLVFDRRIVVEAAPIISYMKGWRAERVADYVKRKGWGIASVPTKGGRP